MEAAATQEKGKFVLITFGKADFGISILKFEIL